jgi:hypothetical protein
MSNKVVYGIVAAVVVGGILGVSALQRAKDRAKEAMRPEHRDRYYDTAAIQEYSLKMERPNATLSGVVVNNTWKTRDIGVWAGFVKSDGFHQGSTVGRNYFGYQYFPQVPPKATKTFTITFAVPPLNRSWSVVAEFDPGERQLRPIWVP